MAVVLGLLLRGDRLAPARARAAAPELETLLAAMRDDGFIGHVVFWDQPLTFKRLVYYNVDLAPRRDDRHDPAAAARLGVADRRRRPRGRAARSPSHHEWLRANRDLEGDGLLWLVQPDESGLDSSPKFDPVWGRRAHAELRLPAARRAQRGASAGTRAGSATAGWPVLCEVDDQRALGPGAAWRPASPRSRRRWSTGSGTSAAACFLDEVQPGGAAAARSRPGRRSRRSRCPTCRRRSAAGWSRSTCSIRAATGSPYPPPSVSADGARRSSPTAGPAGSCGYWRGPTWVNAAWMLWLGLRPPRLRGRGAPTSPRRLEAPILREGLREYYDPRTGEGLGARDFAWTSLTWRWREPDPRRRRATCSGR